MLKNISTDIEYSGDPISARGQGSILSLGSCEVGNINNSFYSELQPINRHYNNEAMAVVSPGFKTIGDTTKMTPVQVLEALKLHGKKPEECFGDYAAWLEGFTDTKLREIACPIKFDGGLKAYYFRMFADYNPLSFSGEDGNSMLRGFLNDQNTSFSRLGIQQLGGGLPHNALQDAQIQSIWIEFLLRLMKDNTESRGEILSLYMREGKEKFLLASGVKEYTEWCRDTVSDIATTEFGKDVNYRSIL